MIHVYGFTNESNQDSALGYFVERISQAMNYPDFKAEDVTCFHQIRDVSPQSHMYSTSFRLPMAVALDTKQAVVEENQVKQSEGEEDDTLS